MPRAPRIHINGGLYHIIMRGNHRGAIFEVAQDREAFERILAAALQRHDATIHAYCWMTNHLHAIVQVGNRPLGGLVQLVASRYARHFQRRVPTTGHLFERRYRARVVTDTTYLLQAVRYIHLNPVVAGMVEDPADYAWSSHRSYLSGAGPAWLCVDHVLRQWGTTRRAALAAYLAYLGTPCQRCDVSDWVERRGQRMPPIPANENTGAGGPSMDLDTLVANVADRYGLSPDTLASAARARKLSVARAALAHDALSLGVATLVEVAARIHRAPSTLSSLLARYGDGSSRPEGN